MGKLFGKEGKDKKATTDDDVNAFLHGSSDKLNFASPDYYSTNQPVLSRIDTTSATRWPSATEVNNSRKMRGRSASPTRSRKGLVVHFTHEEPEIIGEGGDEAEAPTSQISFKKRAQTHPQPARPRREDQQPEPKDAGRVGYGKSSDHRDGPRIADDFQAAPLQRVQTGHEVAAQRRVEERERHHSPYRDRHDEPSENAQLRPRHSSHERPSTNRLTREMNVSEGKALKNALSGELDVSDEEDASNGSSPESKRAVRGVVSHVDGLRIGNPQNRQASPTRAKASTYSENPYELHNNGDDMDSMGGSPASAWSSTVESTGTADSPQSSFKSASYTPAVHNSHSTSRAAQISSSVPVESPKPISRSATFKQESPPDNSQIFSKSSTVGSALPEILQAMSRSATIGSASASQRPQAVLRSATDNQVNDNPQVPARSTASRFQEAAMATVSDSSKATTRKAASKFQDVAQAVGDEALREFSERVSHLFTLFRLSAESKGSLSKCSFEEMVRLALWWFVKGRSDLETTIRDRSTNSEAQQANYFARQQAHADLAKSLWILQMVSDQYPDMPNGMEADFDPQRADIVETRQSITANLRKLTMSMKRNNILPPGNDGRLQKGLNSSVWVQTEGNQSLLGLQRPSSSISLSQAFPLGDTSAFFHYGRMFVDSFLIEEGQTQTYRCPCLVSVVRSQKDKALRLVVANQDTTLKFCVQHDKSFGPTWEEVNWRTKSDALDVKLPRGFKLQLMFTKKDFRTLLGVYDWHKKLHTNLRQRQDEDLVFEKVVKSFQYFDQDPQSTTFPKESMPHCQVRFFEKYLSQKGTSGVRRIHQGFRVALITGIKTKELRGISQDLTPTVPMQLGVLRGEGGSPALLIKLDDGRSKFAMAYTFDKINERTQLHSLLVGSALGKDESIVAETRINTISIESNAPNSLDTANLRSLSWQGLKVINEDGEDIQSRKTVLSDHMRVVMDFKTGLLTDRINAGPGELRLRLDVRHLHELKVLRGTQQDMTMSLFDAQASNAMPAELTKLLSTVARSDTIRTYVFPGLQELHMFQAALTGFVVLFDGAATSFNISRRRMVVPIYKKWEAVITRLQVVQKEGAIQLLAFFENFTHGDCMNFVLKGTDIFEASSRNGKQTLRIVDAKFPMPKTRRENGDVGDSGFVSLDLPEYPGEHDDITIVFETEAGEFQVLTFYNYSLTSVRTI